MEGVADAHHVEDMVLLFSQGFLYRSGQEK